jgi:cyclohexanecarboxylate-CoA ligase
LTFGAFAVRVDQVAGGLRQLGVREDTVVSWQLPSWWESAVLAVAIDRIGAIGNPIIPIYREREVAFIAAQADSRVLVVPGKFRNFDYRELAKSVGRATSSLEHIVVVRDRPLPGMIAFEELRAAISGSSAPSNRDPHQVAMLFYTSGTTSEPKGVAHTRSTLGAFARVNASMTGGGPDDVSLLQFPLTHIGGLAAFVILPILQGSRVVYLDVWEPERALSLIEAEHVTGAGGPPAILQGILNAEGFTPERVRTVRVAGTGAADVPSQLIRDIRQKFGAISFRAYGLTECPMLTSGTASDPEDKCALTDGRPAPGCTVRIVADDGAVVGDEREGEIEAFGPQMCVGYLDQRLMESSFAPDGFLRTGDLGAVDADGYVRVTGRKKDIIIRKGENLSAKAIEDVLHEHPAIADVAVIGVPDPISGERVCACVVLRDGADLSLGSLRSFMESKQVMRQKIPEQLETLSTLPRNATGKVLKFELRNLFGGH